MPHRLTLARRALAQRYGTPLPNLSTVLQLFSDLSKYRKPATRLFSAVPERWLSRQLWRCACSTDNQALSRSGLSYAGLLFQGDR